MSTPLCNLPVRPWHGHATVVIDTGPGEVNCIRIKAAQDPAVDHDGTAERRRQRKATVDRLNFGKTDHVMWLAGARVMVVWRPVTVVAP